ncbi:MAG: hypothetical protein QM715_16240 [Nibricoccus sp.]
MPLLRPPSILREEEESPEDTRCPPGAPLPAPSALPGAHFFAAPSAESSVKSTPIAATFTPLQNAGVNQLLEERNQILADTKLSAKEKLGLLENNRVTLLTLRGGRTTRSDEVVKWVLMFAAFTTIVLAILNVAAGLPTEVTLSFVGTVLGGTIATIVQKLGRV